jgi:hypothetical protein
VALASILGHNCHNRGNIGLGCWAHIQFGMCCEDIVFTNQLCHYLFLSLDVHATARGGLVSPETVPFMPLRVAGAFRQKPFRQVSGTFLRAGASTPRGHPTRNGCWWLANAG